MGLAMTEPIAPVKREYAIFYPKVRFLFSLILTLSSKTLNIPRRMPQ